MRAGICSIQLQALTPEAANTVKQAVNLATRRGHAQVTPLHVASAMLATSTGLLRRACLQCHSHPLQCKALELCFNVALNRLPASTPSPLLGPHYSTPSLSNALVAAFKRAQAHQRRGSIENQQQPILALKIEIEQLIISILDDPSVSRVMREAGFSSTLVKTRVEQAVSIEVCSQNPPSRTQSKEVSSKPQVVHNNGSQISPFGNFGGSSNFKALDHMKQNDDVSSVLSELLSRRRNAVIVGESLSSAEGVARGVIERFERGNVPGDLQYVQFVSLPLMSFRSIGKDEVENRLMELRCLVKSYVGRGVVLYLGDLKWLFEFWSSYCEQRANYYCSVEHLVMELKKMVACGEAGRLWLMGIATFRTYMKCKTCHPSLESLWELHPFTVPVGGLSLGLNFDSDFQAQERRKVTYKDGYLEDHAEARKHLTCCRDCSLNFEKEAQSISSKKDCSSTINTIPSSSTLPIWLQHCKEETRNHNNQECASLKDLCKKWNSFCSSVHRHIPNILERPLKISSSSPSSPTSVPSHDGKSNSLHQNLLNWSLAISEPKESQKECDLYTETAGEDHEESNLIMFIPNTRNVPKPDLLSNPNSSPNSASSSEAVDGLESTEMFKELNAENLKILSEALEKKVPNYKDTIIPEIASAVLLCRSGMRKRDQNQNLVIKREDKQETWMFFLGVDESQAKENISRELAKVVFGSYNNFVTIGISSFSSTRNEESSKRARDEFGRSYLLRFGEAVNENPHRVFFMEDLDQVDDFSQKGIKKAIESGSITLAGGESVPLKDAIVIFSCESFSASSRAPRRSKSAEHQEEGKNENKDKLEEQSSSGLSLDLNIAIEDDAKELHLAAEDAGILELVDKQIVFNSYKNCERRTMDG